LVGWAGLGFGAAELLMHVGYQVGPIFMYRDHVDFRKSIDGLSAIVEMELQMNICSGALFLFINRGRDKMKILYWSRNGFCLWYKRLEREKFAWMKGAVNSSCEISSEELRWLLEGVDIWTSRPHKSLKYMANT
jgi:transposase